MIAAITYRTRKEALAANEGRYPYTDISTGHMSSVQLALGPKTTTPLGGTNAPGGRLVGEDMADGRDGDLSCWGYAGSFRSMERLRLVVYRQRRRVHHLLKWAVAL